MTMMQNELIIILDGGELINEVGDFITTNKTISFSLAHFSYHRDKQRNATPLHILFQVH